MRLKEIVSNTIWFGIIPKLTILITVLITPMITPYMTPEDYGIIGVISAYVGTISGFATFGLHIHLTNSYYEYKHHFMVVWRRLMFWMAIGAFLSMLITICLLWFKLPDTFPWPRWCIVILASLGVLLCFNNVIAQNYYNLKLQPKPLVVRNMIGSLSGIAVMFVVVYYLRWGYMGYVISTAVSALTLFLLFVYPLWYKLKIYPYPNPFNRRVKWWLKVAVPVIPHNVGHVLLSSSDRIIMSVLPVSTYDIGIYSNGYTFGEYGSVLILALVVALGPVMQTTFRKKNFTQMRKILIFSELVSLVIIVGLSLWMREIYQLLVRNEELQICHTVAGNICFSYAMYPLYAMISTPAIVEKKTWNLLWLVFVPALLNIILNFLFIPYYGYRAAIITTIIAYWVVSIIVLLVPYYREHLTNWLGNPFRIIWLPVICIIAIISAQWLGEISVVCKSIITFIFLSVCLLIVFMNRQKIRNFSFDHVDID